MSTTVAVLISIVIVGIALLASYPGWRKSSVKPWICTVCNEECGPNSKVWGMKASNLVEQPVLCEKCMAERLIGRKYTRA